MKAPLLLDVSRLLARAQRGAPTGIDRVEHAYAEQLLRLAPERLRFVAIDKLDRLCVLPQEATRRFIAAIGAGWRGDSPAELGAAARMIWLQAALRPTAWSPRRQVVRPVYLLISHRHLHRRDRVARALASSGARLVAFVHDLIPIQFPEYARPQHADIHLRRIQTVAALADAVIVNSTATGAALQPYLQQAGRAPPVLMAPLGVQPRPVGDAGPVPGPGPYFVYLSTIEPRKNHLLLLHIWRRLAETLGPATPRLILAGRRGWENEMVVDMLERSSAVHPFVSELAEVTDARIGALLQGCRALLFPSFAEGFGLPLAEALMAGVPALCSDLPALREVGGDVPDYLDPLDGLGWLQGVLDYRAEPSPRRAAQLGRMAQWSAASWPGHLAAALAFVDALPPQRAAA